MFNSLKLYVYFYIMTLPFTLLTLCTIGKQALGMEFSVFFTPIFNIFVSLSIWTYFKKIKPLIDSEGAKSKTNILSMLFVVAITILFINLSGEVSSLETEVSMVNDSISNIEYNLRIR